MSADARPNFVPAAKPRPPWGLVGALVLVALAELWVRSWPTAALVAYRADADQIAAVRGAIARGPTPEVAIVGSSLAYQGVAVPELRAQVEARLGRPVTVGNYAIRGARVDLFDATVRDLLRRPVRPKLVVVGIAMRDLREHGLELERLSEFWTLADHRRAARADGSWLVDQLPQVVRNEVARASALVRYRAGIATRLEGWFLGGWFVDAPPEPMPALGGRPSHHLDARRAQTLASVLGEFHRPTNKRRMLQTYRLELGARPPKALSDRVGSIVEQCRRAGVGVMFVDLPLSRPLRELIDAAQRKTKYRDASRDFDPEYRRAVERFTRKAKVPFVQQAELGIAWTDDDFYDAQHLNYAGAVKMSAALAPRIATMLESVPPPN